MNFSIGQQIEEARREILMREKLYPQWVAKRRFSQSEADYFMGRMRAVLATLLWVEKHQEVLKEAIKAKAEVNA